MNRIPANPFAAKAAGLTLTALLTALSITAQAVPIGGLFNTGVDGAGNALAAGSLDPHYAILSPSQSAVVIQDAIPGTWIDNAANYRWVWQTVNGTPTNVTRTFRTTFDLTGMSAATAALSGTWATDNSGSILLNGGATGNICGGFSAFCSFSINSGFTTGINTLDFQVTDVGVISGLLVGSITGNADSANGVPEPATLALLGISLAGIGRFRKSRSANAWAAGAGRA